ncbi:MAG: GAF domain-containing protein, partial [Elusimicrobia bacterium]|nr:GAF domain-containing protein [Elusimicrobiota bacterium]
METCPNCNKIILSDYKFCPRCGFSLYGEPAAGSENGIIIQNPNQESATLFFELAKNLGEATNIDLLLKKIGNAIEKILNAERSSTLLLDETEKFLFFKVASGDSALQKLRIPLNKGIAGWIATNRKGVIVNDPYSDKRFSSETDKTTRFKTTSIVGVPLLIGNTLIGVYESINKKYGGFTEEDLQILTK